MKLLLYQISCTLLLFSSVSLAQELSTDDATAPSINTENFFHLSLKELGLIQVVSVASLFQESDLETANTVTVINEDDWQLRGARRTNDAIGDLPGVALLPVFGGGDAISVRGFGQQLSVRGLSTQIDGITINTSAFGTAQYSISNLNLGVLDKIEFIRGPGSAVHGADAFHGVFSMKTFESEENTTRVDAEHGSNRYFKQSIKHSSQLTENVRLNIALAASGQSDQNQHFNYTANGLTETQELPNIYMSKTTVFKLKHQKSPDRYYQIGFYHDRFNANDVPGFGTTFFVSQIARSAMDHDTELTLLKLNSHQKFANSIHIDAVAYYSQTSRESFYADPFSTGGISENKEAQNRYGASVTAKQELTTLNTRWLVTADYSETEIDDAFEINNDYGNNVQTKTTFIREGYKRDAAGIAFSGRTRFFDKYLDVVYGLRSDKYSDFDQETSPRLGLIMHPKRDLAIKLLYGEAYRAPTVSESQDSPATAATPIRGGVNPESIETLELVFMKRTSSLKAELIFFQAQWKDGITLVDITDPVFTKAYVNLTESSSEGIEVVLQWRGQHWYHNTSASYVTSQNDDTNFDNELFPKIMFNFGVGYRFVDNQTNIYLHNRYHEAAASVPYSDGDTIDKLDEYWRTDLHIKHDIRMDNEENTLSYILNIRNLFDRDNKVPSVWKYQGGLPDDVFSISAGISYTF